MSLRKNKWVLGIHPSLVLKYMRPTLFGGKNISRWLEGHLFLHERDGVIVVLRAMQTGITLCRRIIKDVEHNIVPLKK